MRSAVIGNAGTLVVFRVGSRDAELLARQNFAHWTPAPFPIKSLHRMAATRLRAGPDIRGR